MQLDDARGLIAALGNLPPDLQAAGRRRVAERIAAEGVVDLAAGRVYRFKHGWIPLTHAAALRVTHGNHEKASALLAKHHGPDGSHTARVTPSKHGGFNVTHRGELQAHWNSEADAVKHAAKLNGGRASNARVTPSAHGGFNVIHKGKLQGNWPTQAEADRHAARVTTTTRPKARTTERTLASRQPAADRDKATPPRSVLHSGSVKPMDTTPGNRSAMTLSEQGLQDAGLTPGSRVTVGAMDAPNPTFSKAALPGVHTIVRPARNGNVTVRHEASGSTHDVHVSRLSPVETTPSVAAATHPSLTGEPVQVGDPVAFGKAGRDRWHVVRQLGDGKVQIRSEHLSGRGVGHVQATRTVDSSRLRHLKKGT